MQDCLLVCMHCLLVLVHNDTYVLFIVTYGVTCPPGQRITNRLFTTCSCKPVEYHASGVKVAGIKYLVPKGHQRSLKTLWQLSHLPGQLGQAGESAAKCEMSVWSGYLCLHCLDDVI